MMKPLLVLDRDGVLNSLIYDTPNGRAPRNLDEIRYLAPLATINELHSRYKITCVTNQPDIANFQIDSSMSLLIHHQIMDYYKIQESYLCQHRNSDNCNCRKPKTMLLEFAETTSANSAKPIFVGDRWTDIAAGNLMDWTSILINTDGRSFSESSQGSPPSNLIPAAIAESWGSLARILLQS